APAMPAYVGKHANRTGDIANDHDWQVAEIRRKKIPRARHLPGMSDVLPAAMEDALLLRPKNLSLHIPPSRQRLPALKRADECRVGVKTRCHSCSYFSGPPPEQQTKAVVLSRSICHPNA